MKVRDNITKEVIEILLIAVLLGLLLSNVGCTVSRECGGVRGRDLSPCLSKERQEMVLGWCEEAEELRKKLATSEGVIAGFSKKVQEFEDLADVLRDELMYKDFRIKELEAECEKRAVVEYVEITEGDWLSKFASDFYGDVRLWPFIWWDEGNREAIEVATGQANPDLIVPGISLLIPAQSNYSKEQKGAAVRWHNQRYECGAD